MLSRWQLFQLSCNILCLVVYSLFTWSVMRARRGIGVSKEAIELIRGPFFTLQMHIAICSLLLWWAKFYEHLRVWGIAYEVLDLLTVRIKLHEIAYFFLFALSYNYGLLSLVETFNRCTAVLKPMKYLSVWSTKTVRMWVALCWLTVLIVCAPLLRYSESSWIYRAPNSSNSDVGYGSVVFHYPKVIGAGIWVMIVYFLAGVIEGVLCVIINIIAYSVMVLKIVRMARKQMAKHNNSMPNTIVVNSQKCMGRRRRHWRVFPTSLVQDNDTGRRQGFKFDRTQLNLTLIGGLQAWLATAMTALCATSLFVAYEQLVDGEEKRTESQLAFVVQVYLFPIASDLVHYSPPFLVLLCSSAARKQLLYTMALVRKEPV